MITIQWKIKDSSFVFTLGCFCGFFFSFNFTLSRVFMRLGSRVRVCVPALSSRRRICHVFFSKFKYFSLLGLNLLYFSFFLSRLHAEAAICMYIQIHASLSLSRLVLSGLNRLVADFSVFSVFFLPNFERDENLAVWYICGNELMWVYVCIMRCG